MYLILKKIFSSYSLPKERFLFIDLWKIFAIVNMAFYQTYYTTYVIQGVENTWLDNNYFLLWQKYILGSFIIISGMTLNLCRNNLARAIKFIILGMLISLLSYLFMPQYPNYYDILLFLGTSIIIINPLLWWFSKAPASCGIILSAIGYELTRHLADNVIGWNGKIILNLPDWLYGPWNIWLGLPQKDFLAVNYVPLLPNIFLLLVGFYLLRFLLEHKCGQKYLNFNQSRFLIYMSNSSLVIYLMHYPIMMFLICK